MYIDLRNFTQRYAMNEDLLLIKRLEALRAEHRELDEKIKDNGMDEFTRQRLKKTKLTLREEIVKYAGNDLLLYRAEAPASLVERQEELWDSALVKLARHFGVSFQPTIGILHQPQPAPTLGRLNEALAGEALFPLTAMNAVTSITGSGLLALALRHRLLDAEQVWRAAHVDEDHNIALWGAQHHFLSVELTGKTMHVTPIGFERLNIKDKDGKPFNPPLQVTVP